MPGRPCSRRRPSRRPARTKPGFARPLAPGEIDEIGERSYHLYSGGEAFRTNFALRLALSKVLAKRAGARLRLLIIDEGFGTQDSQGLEQLVEAIQAMRGVGAIVAVTVAAEVADGAQMDLVSRRNLKPAKTVAELAEAGFTPASPIAAETPAAVTRLRQEDGQSYWMTFKNFYVITRYNRSPLYAMAVYDLSQAILEAFEE